MAKYIDADRLRKAVEKKYNDSDSTGDRWDLGYDSACEQILEIIDSLQQDDTQVDKMLCSQIWWEEQGWMMIPPDATIEGIDSLLKQVRKKLQQEQPDDICSVIKEYYGKQTPLEDERKAAYHFFSAGRAFELKKIEEERVKHITDLLDNYQKGKKAGYKEAISELKKGKVECSPVMKELIDKLFGIGNAFNFGFGPKDFLQEQPKSSNGKFVFPDFLYARTVDNKTIDVSYVPQSMDAVEYIKNDPTEQPKVDLEKEIEEHSIQMPMSEFTHDREAEEFIEWAKKEFRHFYELGLNARKEE